MKEIVPNFRTPNDDLNDVEQFKLRSGIRGSLREQFSDSSVGDVDHETEALAKSHGIYLEFNRAKTGKEKEWSYMIRISIPGGGPLSREQYRILDDVASKYTADDNGLPSLRMTTRQNIQFHWVKKENLMDLIRTVAESGFYTLNGCGDNVRNVMGCPCSRYSNIYDANALAQKFGQYFQLDLSPHVEVFGIDPKYVRTPEESYAYGNKLLNRKFKIAFSAAHLDEKSGKVIYDNCVELRTNDLGVAPIVEKGKVKRFQIFLGGGQGERNGKAGFAALGKPLGIVDKENLQSCLDAIVKIHEEWGDRQNRHWARIKYVVHVKGIQWYHQQLKAKGIELNAPDESLPVGPRHLHHGWMQQPSNKLWSYGVFIECGRIIDREEMKLKTMVRHIMDNWDTQLLITANQDIIFTDIAEEKKDEFEAEFNRFGYGQRNGRDYSPLRRRSGACVALPTCRLAYTESERFLPELIDMLEEKGYGNLEESIGITGCERQCFRPATKTIGWVGSGKNVYQLKLLGSEDSSTQGRPLVDGEEKMYMRMVPRDQVATVITTLVDLYRQHRNDESETMGQYHNRIGLQTIIDQLKTDPGVAPLMEKTFKTLYLTPD
jgi:sulfite reductase beta subunit-like hemoprotein